MELKSYQQRVVDEKDELDVKANALDRFTRMEVFAELPFQERNLLRAQLYHMQAYSSTLGQRIARFNKES